MVIWPAFRMGQYRVNDHPYHAPQFTYRFENLYKQITSEEEKLDSLRDLHLRIKVEAGIENNPYTWFTIEELEEIWNETEKFVTDRKTDLGEELFRQEKYDQMRKQFADFANKFGDFINSIR